MLTALSMAAAMSAASTGTAEATAPKYVADYVPVKAVSLDHAKICREGFVDPDLLAVQLIVQFEMFDALRTESAREILQTFDGRTCPKRAADGEGGRLGAAPHQAQKGACAASIVVQRMLLNVYPGYLPTKWHATHASFDGGKKLESLAMRQQDFEADVAKAMRTADGPNAQLERVNAAAVLAFTQRFIASADKANRHEKLLDKEGKAVPPKLSAVMVECDFADKAMRVNPSPKPPEKANEFPTFERSGVIADGAEGGIRVARALRVIQFRQYAGNLVYRGAADGFDSQHATYATGRDLYATDAGFSFSMGKDLGDEASGKYNRVRKESLVGAIGVPLCGLRGLKGQDCEWKPQGQAPPKDKNDVPTEYKYDLIPYISVDRAFRKTRQLYTTDPVAKDKSGDMTEFGLVGYLATDDKDPRKCAFWSVFRFSDRLTNCASYSVVRAYSLKNELDGSRLDAWSFRYTPLIKTSTPGLGSFDVCLNAVCGDPDRWLRTGLLVDARFSQGWYDTVKRTPFAPTYKPEVIDRLNRDYARLGYRAGFLGSARIIPDLPLNFWAAYTDFETLKGFDGDLGEIQTQVSVALGAATVAFNWRNGRREDTAKRDSTYSLAVGFKTR